MHKREKYDDLRQPYRINLSNLEKKPLPRVRIDDKLGLKINRKSSSKFEFDRVSNTFSRKKSI